MAPERLGKHGFQYFKTHGLSSSARGIILQKTLQLKQEEMQLDTLQ